jgi:glycerate dehydrogenase
VKLVLLDALTLGSDIDLKIFENYGELVVYETTNKEQTLTRIKEADIVLTNKVILDETVLKACERLKLICVMATGTNNVDLEYAKQKGIVVKNVAGYSTHSVAQITFTLLLSLITNSAYYDGYVKSKEWSKSPIFTHLDKTFFEIHGKRWGIIGLGTIGKEVAKIATAFGAKVVYFSTSGANHDTFYERVSLREIMQSDIISIHAPLNEKTANLIDKNELALMKKGSVIINVGRGGIINEEALAKAIDEQDILAGIDVTQVEPILSSNPLLHVKKKEHLLFSPHIAWASVEARDKLVNLVAKNIEEFLEK